MTSQSLSKQGTWKQATTFGRTLLIPSEGALQVLAIAPWAGAQQAPGHRASSFLPWEDGYRCTLQGSTEFGAHKGTGLLFPEGALKIGNHHHWASGLGIRAPPFLLFFFPSSKAAQKTFREQNPQRAIQRSLYWSCYSGKGWWNSSQVKTPENKYNRPLSHKSSRNISWITSFWITQNWETPALWENTIGSEVFFSWILSFSV